MEHPTPSPVVPGEGGRRWGRLFVTAFPAGLLVLCVVGVHVVSSVLAMDLHRWGIWPRSSTGLLGIATSPLVHGDLEHLVNNMVPLFVLGWALHYFFPQAALRVWSWGWLVSGVLVWCTARDSYHIGASGLVYVLAAFLFTSGLLRRQRSLMGLSLLVVFLYGGMVWGIFPIVPRISWESHFWGLVVGVTLAYWFRHLPSAVVDRVPDLEDDPDEEPTPTEEFNTEADEQGVRGWRSTTTWDRDDRPRRDGG